jgi:ATP-independent RNA helicase DbpA
VEQNKVDSIREQVNDECKIETLESLGEPKSYLVKSPMKTIFISGGKKDKLRPGDILGALVKEAGLEASDVGNISILPIDLPPFSVSSSD